MKELINFLYHRETLLGIIIGLIGTIIVSMFTGLITVNY